MSIFSRHPALKRALANQYQAILLVGAASFSLVLANPLPMLIWAGAQFVTLPWIVDRLRRRLELEKKLASRTASTVTQEEQYRDLTSASRERFVRLKSACEKIQANYRSLAAEAQGVLAEQGDKLEAILVSCLRRLWLLKKHDELDAAIDEEDIGAQVAQIERQLEAEGMDTRERDAWAQNLAIKRRVLETAQRNRATRATLVAELDSIESLLQLLLQKSLAASNAEIFAAELDDALAQAEADERTVHEMEELVGAEPLARRERLSDGLRGLALPPSRSGAREASGPPPPPPQRGRVR